MSPAVYARSPHRQFRVVTGATHSTRKVLWNPGLRDRGRSWDVDMSKDALAFISSWRSGRHSGAIR